MADKIDRRKFLQLSAFSTPLFAAKKNFADNFSFLTFPIVISTWDTGMQVNAAAWKILSANGRAVDAIETGARHIEDTLNCCVGLGGNPDRDGIVTLDACIMDEHSNCGAVAGLEQIKHPISVARKVMETTPHVLLVGNGAQQFAIENGFAKEPAQLSESAEKAYKEWLKTSQYKPLINIENKKSGGPFAPNFLPNGTPNHDTMGLLAMDTKGNLSGGVTTSGMAFKLHGRVGDSAVIGAGLFVDNEVGAATSSGVGEEVIRICGTHLVVEFMRQGNSPEMACKKAVDRIVKRNPEKAKTLQVGFLAINKKGVYGAYAIQKGFVFSVKSGNENKIHESKYAIG
ncbi:MAG: N(4)-(beta-N-acetylglucosaminyl)-L-asparaginase [Ferruginibacter sp.]|nr:N(4)-(beta-N-acetylglucosaminyl)-L-asparaginase [Ferruginibacter sp.]